MNKTLIVSGLFLTVMSVIAIPVQAAETKKPHQKADFLKTVDTNNDAKASKAEFIAAMEKKFSSLDVDKNEAVSVQELKVYGEKDEEARRKALEAAKQSANFGKITSKKKFVKLFTERGEREFAALDKNHDNELSADEVGAEQVKKKKHSKVKQQEKKPMSKAEFVAMFSESAERNFIRLDKNRDGKLTESELGIKPKAQAVAKNKEKITLPQLPNLSGLIPSLPKPQTVDKKAQQQKLIKSFFVGIDANNDGKISSKEKTAVFERLFNRLDTNHDQHVTQEEIIAGRHTPLSGK